MFISLLSYAQSVSGIVEAEKDREPVGHASVRILNEKDSTYITGAATSEKGTFNIKLSKGRFILEISYLSYKAYHKNFTLTDENPHLDLGVIKLKENSILLNEAQVVATPPDITVKGDTIEYNALAYTVGEGAMLLDLVKTIPGIEVDSKGQLMANGRPITKILVDGKEFFGNNLKIALENLPASMINKLQLFKEQSELAQITGIKNTGSNEQVLNLVVKEELKRSFFGDIKAGYGSDGRYSNQVNGHYMIDENLYSVIGNMNNVTNDFEYSGGGSGQYDGITKTEDMGFTFSSQQSKKVKIEGNVLFESNNNRFEMESNTRYFIPTGDRMSTQSSSTTSIRKDLSTRMRLLWTPDSLTTISSRISMNTSNNDDINRSNSKSYQINQPDSTLGWSNYFTDNNAFNINGTFMVGRKLNNKGRNISMSLSATLRGNNSTGSNLSNTIYQESGVNKILDQELDNTNRLKNWNIALMYVEPLNKDNSLIVSYNARRENSVWDKNTYKRDGEGEYSKIDKEYTRNTKSDYLTQRLSFNLQSVKNKFEFNLGISIDPTSSKSKIMVVDSIIEDQTQNTINISPTFRLTYSPKNSMSLDFSYSGNSEKPTLKQLSPDTVIINPLYKMYGNPNLKGSFTNNVSIYFLKSNYEKGSFLTVSAGGSYVLGKIVDYTETDNQGNTRSTYRNVDGNWSGNFNFTFSTPLKNKKFTVSNTFYSYYYRNIGFSNGVKNITHSLTSGESVRVGYRSDKIEQSLSAGLMYTLTRNKEDMNIRNYSLNSSSNIKFPYRITLQNEIGYTYNNGYSKDFKKSELLWNASLAKSILKNKGTIKVQCYDILKQRNNISRVPAANYVSDTRTNMIGRYLMLSFIYKFNIIKGGSGNESQDTNSTYGLY